jgi:hypothetical protein
MRTTVDIPDETYRGIRVIAAERGCTVRKLILEGLEAVMRTNPAPRRDFEPAATPSTLPGSLEIDNEAMDDIIGFP